MSNPDRLGKAGFNQTDFQRIPNPRQLRATERRVTPALQAQLHQHVAIADQNAANALTAINMINVARLGFLPLFAKMRDGLAEQAARYASEANDARRRLDPSAKAIPDDRIKAITDFGARYARLTVVQNSLGSRPNDPDLRLLYDFGVVALAATLRQHDHDYVAGTYDPDTHNRFAFESAVYLLKYCGPDVAIVRGRQLREWLNTAVIITEDVDYEETYMYRAANGTETKQAPFDPFNRDIIEADHDLYEQARAATLAAASTEITTDILGSGGPETDIQKPTDTGDFGLS